MNIACISHYSPLYKNKSNAWMQDFYSSVDNFADIKNVYFFHISYEKQKEIEINKVELNKNTTDISIIIPRKYKILRKLNTFDKKFISIINKVVMGFLSQNKIEFDIIHVNTLYYAFFIDIFKSNSDTGRFFLHLHENNKLLNNILNKRKYSSINFIGKYDYVIRQTASEINVVKKYNNRILYLPNAFDDSNFHYAEKRADNEKITILSIGYLRNTKNYKLSLEVVKNIMNKGYDVNYNIIGSGPELKTLRKYAKKVGMDNIVTFHGYQNKEDIQKFFKNSDLLLNTSYFESFGNVFLEALKTGTPIVTCAKGGPEYIFKWASNNMYLGEHTETNIEKISEAVIKVVKVKQGIIDMRKVSQIVSHRFSSERFLNDLIDIGKNGEKNVNEWWKN
ncbi:glycosyltransferase family 4 protein [Virgibacillus kekensis]|uniref:Glycosyltransferase family 4 protein n=1 Tax=Virgibacillus kekensis TaxID=202261 RepID=A0ABV9DIN3_9BACI